MEYDAYHASGEELVEEKEFAIPIPSDAKVKEWWVPSQISLDNGNLVWQESLNGSVSDASLEFGQKSSSGMLKAFLQLHQASDEEIYRFAQRWGVLGLETGLGSPYDLSTHKVESTDHFLKEPVEAYRQWSKKLNAFIKIHLYLVAGQYDEMDYLRQPDKGKLLFEEWKLIASPLLDWNDMFERHVFNHTSIFIRMLQNLLNIRATFILKRMPEDTKKSHIATQLVFELGQPYMRLWKRRSRSHWNNRTYSILVPLAVQMLATMQHEVITCDVCGNPCVGLRKPRADRKHYCSPKCSARRHREHVRNYIRKTRAAAKEPSSD